MSLFANLANLGIPGLSGLDPNELAAAAAAAAAASTSAAPVPSTSTTSSRSKQPKPDLSIASTGTTTSTVTSASATVKAAKNSAASGLPTATVTSSAAASSTASAMPTSAFPFLFLNPGLLYTPLGLGSLNPFALQPGMSSAYDAIAQQCGLLNGNLSMAAGAVGRPSTKANSSGGNSSKSATVTSASSSAATSSQSATKSNTKLNKDAQQFQQLLMPPTDSQFLESLSRAAGSLDPFKQFDVEHSRKDDKKRHDISTASSAHKSLKDQLSEDYASLKSSPKAEPAVDASKNEPEMTQSQSPAEFLKAHNSNDVSPTASETNDVVLGENSNESLTKKNIRRPRTKRKASDVVIDTEMILERKNLRSCAGRAARVAAEKAAKQEAEFEHQMQQQQQQQQSNSSDDQA